jgi:sugar phosphate permease
MVLSDLLRAIVALGFLFIQHPHQIWILYVLTAVQAAVGGVFHPARSAMLPAVVSRSELATANSLSSINFALMQALGSGIGGLAVGVIGVYPTFVVDSATFVVSGILSLCVPARLGRPRPDGGSGEPREHRSLRADVRDGLHYMRSDVEVTLLALHKGANALTISGGLNVLSVSIAQTRFPLGADGGVSVGLLLCATGVGTGIGPVLARGLMRDSEPRMRYLLGLSYIVSSLGMMLIAPMIGMSLVVVGLIIRAIGGGMMFMMTNQLLALRVPGHLRGRIFSVDFAARNLGGALGIVLVSAMIEGGTSIERTTWTLAVMGLVPGVLWLWWTWHRQAHHADTPAVRGA